MLISQLWHVVMALAEGGGQQENESSLLFYQLPLPGHALACPGLPGMSQLEEGERNDAFPPGNL